MLKIKPSKGDIQNERAIRDEEPRAAQSMLIHSSSYGEFQMAHGISGDAATSLPRCLASASREGRGAVASDSSVADCTDTIVSTRIRGAGVCPYIAGGS